MTKMRRKKSRELLDKAKAAAELKRIDLHMEHGLPERRDNA
jgi:hypothetical protein